MVAKMLLILSAGALSGCATILGGGGSQSVRIDTDPSQADIRVVNASGAQVFQGQTPIVVNLKRGDGFFQKGVYTVEARKEGYALTTGQIVPTINPWYFGNIVLGGIIGMLIIDPATGAMYRFDDDYQTISLDALPEQVTRSDGEQP